ncbi:MAG TPA: dethiobiotin synthase [Terriglobales bacterium]|nr:dethiobiotin synthase [Terriglobales bacterium]
MDGVFITGTDTGVGKTVVAAVLALGWPQARYWKPIQCGTDPSTDRDDVAAWTGLPPARLLPEAYRLALPASPNIAAAAAGVEIQPERLALPPGPGPLVVEGAGGVLVPLNPRHTMLDLMAWLALPVVLVARTQLGTINHTLLSLQALRLRGLPIAALVLNGEPVPATTATLRAWAQVEPLVELPPLPALHPPSLAAAFARHFSGWPHG